MAGDAREDAALPRQLPRRVAGNDNPRQPNVPYGHRHHSFLYPVFQSHEFTSKTPALWTAVRASLEKKLAEHCEGSSFGRVQSGLAAAYLHLNDAAYGQIRKMVLEGKWYTSLMTSHDPNHSIFCADANGGLPEVVNNCSCFPCPASWICCLPCRGPGRKHDPRPIVPRADHDPINSPGIVRRKKFTWS